VAMRGNGRITIGVDERKDEGGGQSGTRYEGGLVQSQDFFASNYF
jgi:hypothetical protein